jgi:hypothetical protein
MLYTKTIALIVAHPVKCVEEKRTPFFDEIRNYPAEPEMAL